MRQSQSEVSTSGESSAQVSRGHHHRDSGEVGQGHGEVEAEQSSSVRTGTVCVKCNFTPFFLPNGFSLYVMSNQSFKLIRIFKDVEH